MVHAEGFAAVGEQLTIRMQPVDGKVRTFRPTVLEVEPRRRLRWLGRLVMPGLFDGEHIFTLDPLVDGGTLFIQEERFRGLLVPMFSRALDRGTLPAFELMNEALKRRAEGGT